MEEKYTSQNPTSRQRRKIFAFAKAMLILNVLLGPEPPPTARYLELSQERIWRALGSGGSIAKDFLRFQLDSGYGSFFSRIAITSGAWGCAFQVVILRIGIGSILPPCSQEQTGDAAMVFGLALGGAKASLLS